MSDPLTLRYGDSVLASQDNESLLDAAIKAGVHIPHSCRSGVCQTCLVKVTEGDIPKAAQHGLSDNQKLQGLALACQLIPQTSVIAQTLDHVTLHSAKIISHYFFTETILRLRLKINVAWQPGQFISVWKNEHTARPYSIASLNEEGFIELHIKRHDQGDVSRWLHHDVKPGDSINISDPRGSCFYVNEQATKPLLLAGTGTGLAPLYGIVRQALAKDHQEPIYLYLGGRTPQSLYLIKELHTLATQHSNFHFFPVVRDKANTEFNSGDLLEAITSQHKKFQNWCIFLCGAPDLVRKMQKVCFLNGASMADIHTDPFITA